MAVEAVMRGGRPTVMRGSRTATCGCRSKLTNAIFTSRSVSLMTAAPVTSDPVPAVVGSAGGQHDRRALGGVEHGAAAHGDDPVAPPLLEQPRDVVRDFDRRVHG